MKRIILLLSICFAGTVAFAQIQRNTATDTSAGKQHGKFENKGNKKKELAALNLTREQRGKMKEMAESGKAQKEAIANDTTLTEDQKAAKLQELKRGNAQKMQGILTPEQKEKYRQMKKEKKGNMAP